MKSDVVEKYIAYVISALLGVAFAYFISGLISYELPVQVKNIPAAVKTGCNTKPKYENMKKTIISENVFDIETGRKSNKIERNVKVASSINGYKLVGFVSGSSPMALFKKSSKPVAIVTKNKGIDGVWILDEIKKDGVYLKNKKTKEVKKFEFPSMTKQLSIFGKKLSVTYSKPSYISSNVEKITVSKNILKRVGNINTLFRQINIVPVFRNKKAIGYRINYIAPNSVLRKIGLRTGDIVVSINGEATTSPQKIMSLYSQIGSMTNVNLDIIRNGRKKTIFVDIK